MGMFDTLLFECPACHKTTSQQSKAGPCELRDYTLDTAPLIVIADVNDDGKRGELYCEHCNKKLRLKVQFMVKPALANPDADEVDPDVRYV